MILLIANSRMCFCTLNLSGGHKMIITVVNVSKPQRHETPQASSHFPVQCIVPCVPLWTLISLDLADIWLKALHSLCRPLVYCS